MEIIRKIGKMQIRSDELRREGKRIGFVPTMGYLHEGHLSLMRLAREQSDAVVASIFVNPAQFGPNEDYEHYPRDLERDKALAKEERCDVLFLPSGEEMYPPGYQTYVQVEELTGSLCGPFRPGHFRGVTTIVAKLFNIVKPHLAVFGQKDAQQAAVIQRMVGDLSFDIKILVAPLVREKDGLAISSRNEYLSKNERNKAQILYQSLQKAGEMIKKGERKSQKVIEVMREMILQGGGKKIDYLEIVDSRNLKPMNSIQGDALVALAVWIGKTRLIDNIVVTGERLNG